MSRFTSRRRYGLLFLLLLIAAVPYLLAYSRHFATTAVRSVDEYEYLQNVSALAREGPLSPRMFAFAYGDVYWAAATVLSAPFLFTHWEQGNTVILRLLSLGCSLGAFAVIARSLSRRGYRFAIVAPTVTVCFLTAANLNMALKIHPDTAAVLFMTIAFGLLSDDDGAFGRRYLLAIVAFCVAISIKSSSLLFGIAFAVYWATNVRRIDRTVLVRTALTAGISMFALNIILLDFRVLEPFVNELKFQSGIVRQGWTNEKHAPDIRSFSATYLNFVAFAGIVVAAIVAIVRRHIDLVRGAMAVSVVLAYAMFGLIYAKTPGHYALPIPYFMPLLIAPLIMTVPRRSLRAALVAVLVYAFAPSVMAGTSTLANPLGPPAAREQFAAIESATDIVREYRRAKPIQVVGVGHNLALELTGREWVSTERLWTLEEGQLSRLPLVVLWKQDPYYRQLYLSPQPGFEGTYATYRRLASGEPMNANGESFRFRKISEDDRFEVYELTGSRPR